MMSRNEPDVARLAALDAGLLGPQEATEVRAAATADPRAAAVLDALAATRDELAAQPRPALPPDVAARIAAALDEVDAGVQQAGTAPQTPQTGRQARETGPQPVHRNDPRQVPGWDPLQVRPAGPRIQQNGPQQVPRMGPRELDPSRPPARRHSSRRWVLTAAAVLAVAVAAGIGALVTRPAGPGPASPVLALSAGDLAAAGPAAVGTADLGALAEPVRRAGCLRAVGLAAPAEPVLGGRRVVLDGRPGVLLVLPTGILGSFRLVVVDPACGPDAGTLLADQVAPR